MEQAEFLLQELENAIDNDQLTLPTLPEVALQIREIAEDPDATIKELTSIISTDAALSARIVRIANSPLMRGTVKVDNLHLALSRLGINFVQNIATGLAMEQFFQATSDAVDKRMRRSWEHCKEVASISVVLAKHYTNLPVDKVSLAALVHEIGILPILTYMDERDALFLNPVSLDSIINKIHPEVGHKILTAWDFPPEIAVVPKEYLNFSRETEGNKTDFVDVITIANIQALVGTEHHGPMGNLLDVKAFHRIGLNPEIEMSDDEILMEEFSEVKQTLL